MEDFMGIDRIESLFEGIKDCQAHLCVELWYAEKKMEAKGIFDRSKLTAYDVNKLSNITCIGTKLKEIKYEQSMDFKPIKDTFAPISTPSAEYM